MIKNYEMFKTYFYLFLLDFPELDNEKIENALKNYLMRNPIKVLDIATNNYEIYYDLDYLVTDFKNDDIRLK